MNSHSRKQLEDVVQAAVIYVRDSYPPEAKHDHRRFNDLRKALVSAGYNLSDENTEEDASLLVVGGMAYDE